MSIRFIGQNFAGLQDALQKANNTRIPIKAATGNKAKNIIEIPAR